MKLLRAILRFGRDDDGVGSIYMLALLPLFLILAGFGIDGTAAFRTRDMLQSTADAAAIGGVLKLPVAGSATATQETNAVNAARNYAQLNMPVAGFGNVLNPNAATNGDIAFGNWNGTTFTSPAAAGTAENAMLVTVKTAAANSNAYPTSFLALIGKSSWDIAAAAIAVNGKNIPICVLTFSDFLGHGTPTSNLQGCSMASNANMDCTATSGINAQFGFYVGTYKNCATTGVPSPPTADPYAGLASHIPANPCGATAASFPQEPNNGSPPVSNQWTGSSWPSGVHVDASTGDHIMCGDVQLKGNVSIAGSETLVIENGMLDLNGFNLTTTGSGALTIIFTGPTVSGFTPNHNITGTGTLNISGPTSGTWLNITMYQDPSLTSGLSMTEAGNKNPTWDVSGIIYLPKADLTISGSVNNANNGSSCLIFVANSITINGQGQIIAQGGCSNAPTALAPISRLVQ
jgi:Flp pilus assembly protein TadG